ncbi:antitermination protein NusG [Oleiharenicola lentus]|uniref:Antitermination protein NusG n=1 Tax=Oleiharenicola lentus TaxID=2508720 RepID=A0A4Q1CC07_9BACT|nr:transcription termination/antitermination NusG family protein [Oleiharenicola lentus]RXK56645.1 antitermination protein NusG [Oleiharenicola lentus]
MGQHLPDFAEPRWFVCHTKPRCEKKFDDLVARERFAHYLPLIQSVRRYGTQKKVFTKPLFPGYVFVRIEPEKKTRIYQQDLLVRAMLVDNEAVFLRQLEDVKTVCASGLEAMVHPLMRKGTKVKVNGGPLKGLEGHVDDPANPQGIVVSVDVLQQGLLVRLPMEFLQILH